MLLFNRPTQSEVYFLPSSSSNSMYASLCISPYRKALLKSKVINVKAPKPCVPWFAAQLHNHRLASNGGVGANISSEWPLSLLKSWHTSRQRALPAFKVSTQRTPTTFAPFALASHLGLIVHSSTSRPRHLRLITALLEQFHRQITSVDIINAPAGVDERKRNLLLVVVLICI